MKDYQEKRQVRELFASRIIVLFLFFLIISTGVASFRALMKGWEVRAEKEAAEKRVEELKKEQEVLSSELQDFDSGRGIEREAREKLNLRKPGEEVVIIRDASAETSSDDTTSNKNFFSRIWDSLFN